MKWEEEEDREGHVLPQPRRSTLYLTHNSLARTHSVGKAEEEIK